MRGEKHRPRTLAVLSLLGFASAVWAGFLWSELIVARSGGTPFCAADGKASCVQLWDSPFASTVHQFTGLPVAAWGVLWSILALLFPLLALARGPGRDLALRSAVLVTAAAGGLTVIVLAGTSLAARALCTGCLGTYGLVVTYALIAHAARPEETRLPWRNGALATGLGAILSYLALLYPGLSTPRSAEEMIRPALASPSDPDRTAALERMIAEFPVSVQETLAAMLLEFSVAPAIDEPPRALIGDPNAPVVLTEFSDALCGHCARLHGVLRELSESLPPGSFALESRQFPLDPACNPNLSGPSATEGVRCLAAKIRICLEGNAGLREFNERMFADQLSLDTGRLMELARPYVEESALLECLRAESTEAKLQSDIAYAMRHGIQGTPMVLINGRKGSAFPPFLMSVISAGADPKHPAFQQLPAPKPPR